MPKTAPEIAGLIKREDLGMIKGRSRKPQLQMAKEFGIQDPPNAGGGCLLTDPAFGKRAIDLFDHTKDPTINDIDLLKVGRHFRLDDDIKLIVGRNHNENEVIKSLALPEDIILEAVDHLGPSSMIRGTGVKAHVDFAASVTLRYSDAPKETICGVDVISGDSKIQVDAKGATEEEYLKFRI